MKPKPFLIKQPCSLILHVFYVLFLVFQGGSVLADSLSLKQKLLMPGPLTQAHAEYESQCETCHSAFSKDKLTELCLDCHTDIAKDRSESSRFHGQYPMARDGECKQCHTDHKGRDAEITGLTPEIFDHNFTLFPLVDSHGKLSCNQCHSESAAFRNAPKLCVNCHGEDDVHDGGLGEQCDSCHDSKLWQSPPKFDHRQTNFPLSGKHESLHCVSCHLQTHFQSKAKLCIDCHLAHDIHQGSNGENCTDCHTENSWKELKFDHNTTLFSLTGAHKHLNCVNCHEPGKEAKQASTQCSGCHGKTDIHFGLFGQQCSDCHTTKTWGANVFDHRRDTHFALTGKHQNLSCTQCHIGPLSETLPKDCNGCHAGDDIHGDKDMKLCATCHETESWKETEQFSHDFTHFPLMGMHQLTACESCHIGNQFALGKHNCASCHSSDDPHKQALGDQCENCHTANGWELWRFDHNTQTGFRLSGKHDGLACESCHFSGTHPENTSSTCGRCHRRQDIHDGGLGENCDSCHSTENFFELWLKQTGR